ncbi:Rapid ALkalinization Factor - like 3 [Theobroma cacao]|uniref:Uncharacterized protein n=1 Tax=Theobroma cacao TaxID=3641 RepID=A0A061EN72_THECC|nr:Uncharacterized protein TCM_018922 [Theobroma cacao]WRX20261.1 Rapid ALkalinization Factor - like 3 [Theobroma cacao]
MSEKSSTNPARNINDPLCISTTKSIERQEQQSEPQVKSYETITNNWKGEETRIEKQGVTVTSSLQQVKVKGNISYGSLQKPPVCNANEYGNCIKPVDEDNRPCTVYNRCKRDNH